MAPTADHGERLDAHERAKFAVLPVIFFQRRIYWLRDHGLIEPLAHGTYRRNDVEVEGDPDLVEIAARVPRATLCLASALARRDLTDAIPSKIDIAIPRGVRRPRDDGAREVA